MKDLPPAIATIDGAHLGVKDSSNSIGAFLLPMWQGKLPPAALLHLLLHLQQQMRI